MGSGAETTIAAVIIAIVAAVPPTIAAVAAALAARHTARVSDRTSQQVSTAADNAQTAARKAQTAVGHAEVAVAAASEQSDLIHALVNANMSSMREELKVKDRRIEIQHDDLQAKENEIALLNARNEQLHQIIEALKSELQSVTKGEHENGDAGR